MEEEVLVKLLSNIGVPAALCFYTLYRVSPAIDKLTEAINKLNNDIDKRLDKLEEKTRELSYKIEILTKEKNHE